MLLSDFNLHYLMWGGIGTRYIDLGLEELITIIKDFNLSNTLLLGTITYEEKAVRSTINLCLVTVGLVNRLIKS